MIVYVEEGEGAKPETETGKESAKPEEPEEQKSIPVTPAGSAVHKITFSSCDS